MYFLKSTYAKICTHRKHFPYLEAQLKTPLEISIKNFIAITLFCSDYNYKHDYMVLIMITIIVVI